MKKSSKRTTKRSTKRLSKADSKCGKGRMMRSAYTKKSGTRVKAACIKDIGTPGHGKQVIPPLTKHLLAPYGYTLSLSHDDRVKTIKKAIKQNNALEVMRHLNAIRTLSKNYPRNVAKYTADIDWIHNNYFTK
jgi:hypothetical protein